MEEQTRAVLKGYYFPVSVDSSYAVMSGKSVYVSLMGKTNGLMNSNCLILNISIASESQDLSDPRIYFSIRSQCGWIKLNDYQFDLKLDTMKKNLDRPITTLKFELLDEGEVVEQLQVELQLTTKIHKRLLYLEMEPKVKTV